MARQTDAILAKYVAEIEDRQQFIDGVLESAGGEDLDEGKLELVTRAKERIDTINKQMAPLEEARRISAESSERVAALAKYMSDKPGPPKEVEYRSLGAYVIDRWRAGLGEQEALNRLDVYHRAAAHQTTGDNPGLLPEQILEPVINFIDAARPIVTALGVRQLPAGSWSRPRVTQNTQVGPQTAEKAELVSRKMVISKIPVTAVTYGGYVNVSRQNVDWSQPGIMDIVINDLAAQYAIETEKAAATALVTGATAGPTLAAVATPEAVAGALWAAAGLAFTAVKGAGRLAAIVSPDVLGKLGPLFTLGVGITEANVTGFMPTNISQGQMGSVGGIPIYMSSALAANSFLVVSTAAAEAYEDRIGALQVVEPSVLGIQVAYAGYFAVVKIEPAAVIKITVSTT